MSKFPPQSHRGFWYRFIAFVLRPILKAATARDWRGGEFLRVDQGIVVAMNHLSWYDPLVAAHFVNDNGRPVRFLAKVEVFKIPLLGSILKAPDRFRFSAVTQMQRLAHCAKRLVRLKMVSALSSIQKAH